MSPLAREPQTDGEHIVAIYQIVKDMQGDLSSICDVQAAHETRIQNLEVWRGGFRGGLRVVAFLVPPSLLIIGAAAREVFNAIMQSLNLKIGT